MFRMNSSIPSSNVADTPVTSHGDAHSIVGYTPVLQVPASPADAGSEDWAKLEGRNPNGIKGLTVLHMEEQARARGQLQSVAMIVEPTSGTLGSGRALPVITYHHPVAIDTDSGLEPIVHSMPRAHDAVDDVARQPHSVRKRQKTHTGSAASKHPDVIDLIGRPA